MAQLTDILREWSGGSKKPQKPPLNRRETLADLARSLPWHRVNNDQYSHIPPVRKRRESSADSGIKSMRSRRDSHSSDLTKIWIKKDTSIEKDMNQDVPMIATISIEQSSPSSQRITSRRGSGDDSNSKTLRRDSLVVPAKVIAVQKKRRDSLAAPEIPNFRQEQRPSTSSAESASLLTPQQIDSSCQSIPMPTIITSSVSPTSPKYELVKSGRRDSTTQCRINRRESRLQRQATAYDDSSPLSLSRRGSQSQQMIQISPSTDIPSENVNLCERQARRDSLSPDINLSK